VQLVSQEQILGRRSMSYAVGIVETSMEQMDLIFSRGFVRDVRVGNLG